MENKASITSLMSAFARAYHNENSDKPIFSDTVVRSLISDEEYRQISAYLIEGIDFFAPGRKAGFSDDNQIVEWVVNTQLAPTPLARARFCEDSLKTAIMTGTAQYVILGAGLDTFAWREPDLMKQLSVFEADHPLTQADKLERIKRANLEKPENLHFVPVDFSSDDLREALKKGGFDESKKTFFSWLGVSFYLSETEIGRLFENISSFAAEGSTILFDYADEELFAAGEKRVQNMLAMAAAGGEPMKFCSDEINLMSLLEKNSFLIYEHMTSDEIDNRYFSGRDDDLAAFEHVSYALAVIKGTQFINTKEKILQSALSLFSQNGYKAVSVKDIADRLSITKGALYRHYKSKRDIFDSIVNRMELLDAEWAEQYEMPEGSIDEMADAYKSVQIDRIKEFSMAQFIHWTEEDFPSAFRKMLVLEQYGDAEMASLYQQYLVSGPVGYMEDIFRSMTDSSTGSIGNPKDLAIEYYAPMFLLYSIFDDSKDGNEVKLLLNSHIENFFKRFTAE